MKNFLLLSDITPPSSISGSKDASDYFPVLLIVLAIVSVVLIIFCVIYITRTQKREAKFLSNPNTVKEIICPRCGSREIAVIPEHKKSVIARIFFVVLLILELFTSIQLLANLIQKSSDGSEILFAIFAVGIIVAFMTMTINESETHIKAVCRRCGNTWRHI